MAESTKILQVTFGTYSCTLEGFEDPVEAMIAVTDYFRDLAERDPSFAAGQAQAEDLAQLADQVRGTWPGHSPASTDVASDGGAGSELSQEPWEKPPQEPLAEPPKEQPAVVAPQDLPELLVSAEVIPAGEVVLEGGPGDAPLALGLQGMEPIRAADRQHLLPPPDADEAALSRMLTESDLRLSDPEATRRRATIASLKAAVAATEAARASGPSPEEEREARRDPFRHDLKQVVSSQIPGRTKTAPLRLVASQRVDLPAPPVRMAEEPRPTERPATDFASFAAQMGARSLPDLIEAAAAWRAFVWEIDDVTRPELLRLATQALEGEPSREESLGAFGSLLREGRLDRVASGRFRVRHDSRFNPGRMAG